MAKMLGALCLLPLIAACAISASRPPSGLSYGSLCEAFGNNMRSPYSPERVSALADEISKRGYKDPREWESAVVAKKVQVGMSRCAMYAAWGDATKENRTITAGSVHIQHVFGSYFVGTYLTTKPNFVYTQNDVVTAIQQ